jgi:hypothetical protein
VELLLKACMETFIALTAELSGNTCDGEAVAVIAISGAPTAPTAASHSLPLTLFFTLSLFLPLCLFFTLFCRSTCCLLWRQTAVLWAS